MLIARHQGLLAHDAPTNIAALETPSCWFAGQATSNELIPPGLMIVLNV
ncbi:hypothetical protein [Hymenobacter nivis]|nr:hypothetical protein [Hymenobacter nivis]